MENDGFQIWQFSKSTSAASLPASPEHATKYILICNKHTHHKNIFISYTDHPPLHTSSATQTIISYTHHQLHTSSATHIISYTHHQLHTSSATHIISYTHHQLHASSATHIISYTHHHP
jgi:hypothetical protein